MPRFVTPDVLAGGVVIIVDALRASATIVQALASGAPFVHPVLTVEDARAVAARPDRAGCLLGGERGGVRIEGFDLANSPREYARERVAGRGLVFTTTNGTAALLHARAAGRVLVGSFCNLSALCAAVVNDPRPVHVLCAGTRDEVSLDDCLPAGAMVERLVAAGRGLVGDDSALMCLRAWREASSRGPAGIVEAMLASRGGRGLVRLGLDSDVEWCSRVDTLDVVPAFDAGRGVITAASAG